MKSEEFVKTKTQEMIREKKIKHVLARLKRYGIP